jgi:alpha-ketoglutarate-dependent taurine dioxygenase
LAINIENTEMNDIKEMQLEDLQMVEGLPKGALINACLDQGNAMDWVRLNSDTIQRLLQENGVLLIRGLRVPSSKQLGKLLSTIFAEPLMSYVYRSTPRTKMRSNVYTATEYHPDLVIPQHNENSYSNNWVMRLGFYCVLPSPVGGNTPIADSRKVYNAIPKAIRDKFAEKKVMYVRNYLDIDLSWSEVFQTDDKVEVEAYCLENNMTFEWLDNNGLRTKQINPAVLQHPVTGEFVWFNQAHLFHVSNLGDEIQQNMLATIGEENLPRNTYFGDGARMDVEDLEVIRQVYDQQQVSFRWQANDLLLIDNMLFSHGRQPYTGDRKILVGMTGSYEDYKSG